MAQYKYAFQKFNKELMARVVGRDVAVSTKQAIVICDYLRRRKLIQAKRLLEGVIEKKQAVPFNRFTNGLGHKPGKMGAGRYPVKASRVFMKLLESAEANAQTKGLNTSELELIHLCAHGAHKPTHYGRNSGREFKRSNIEVVVQETTKQKKEKKEGKKEAGKKEEKTKEKKEAERKEKKETEKESKAEEKSAEKKPEEKKEEKKEEMKAEEKKEPKEKTEEHKEKSQSRPEPSGTKHEAAK